MWLRTALWTLCVALVMTCVSPALAQPAGDAPAGPVDTEEPAEKPVSAADREEAKDHFKRGLKLLKEEAWAPALAEFLQSRELFPTRVATNNAAVSLRKLQRYDEALDMYETLLRDFEVPDDEREAAQAQIAELRTLVGTIDVQGAPPGASIVVSSEDRGEYPPVKPIRVPAGDHVVRVFKEGYEPFETRVDVAGGGFVTVDAKLVKLTSAGKLKVVERSGKTVQVVVDNVVVGLTPWEGSLGVGNHVVQLRGTGKLGSAPALAVIEPQELTNLSLVARELESQLRVDPTPPGAQVFIDGVAVGSGVWLGRLPQGPHKVRMSADGFLDEEVEVDLVPGQRERVALELERDDDAPMWRKPSRWTVDASAGLLIVPTFGGDVAASCEDGCSAGPGLGANVLVHGSYELGSGIGFGIELGYAVAGQQVDRRTATLQPLGLPAPHPGTASDSLQLQAFMAGATIAYHLGEEIPINLGTGVGIFYGQMRDERTGSFTPRSGPQDAYSTFAVASFPTVTAIYVDPRVRVGYRFGSFELSGYVQALLLIGLTEPRFDDSLRVNAGSDGIGTYADETVMGSFVAGVVPGVNLRYDFE